MTKSKIHIDTIREIRRNQHDANRERLKATAKPNVLAGIARVASASPKLEAPVALLEQPEPPKELPADTDTEPSVENFTIPTPRYRSLTCQYAKE